MDLVPERTQTQLAHAHLNAVVQRLPVAPTRKRMAPLNAVAAAEIPYGKPSGPHGPLTRWRPDLPGDEGQPWCQSPRCQKETTVLKPGMHYTIAGPKRISLFHVNCPTI